MKTGDLFENATPAPPSTSSAEDRVALASHRLAVEFAEDDQLPTRYRKLSDSAQKTRKPKEDSDIEQRFKANVQAWRVLIETMLTKLDADQAWRFINLRPQVAGSVAKVTDSKDFCDFVDYLIQRRDKEQCDGDELGGLAQLSVAFQRQIEKQIEV